MEFIITSVANPVWANEEHTIANCEITISTCGDEVLPFTADPNDTEPHGRQLFAEISGGVYGPVGEYVPPPPEPTATPASGSLPVEVL